MLENLFISPGDQIRDVMVRNPKLFRISLGNVKKVNFHMNKFLGFRENQIRELFVTVPSIFTIQSETLQKRYLLSAKVYYSGGVATGLGSRGWLMVRFGGIF